MSRRSAFNLDPTIFPSEAGAGGIGATEEDGSADSAKTGDDSGSTTLLLLEGDDGTGGLVGIALGEVTRFVGGLVVGRLVGDCLVGDRCGARVGDVVIFDFAVAILMFARDTMAEFTVTKFLFNINDMMTKR